MTYNVFSGTLNPTQSIPSSHSSPFPSFFLYSLPYQWQLPPQKFIINQQICMFENCTLYALMVA